MTIALIESSLIDDIVNKSIEKAIRYLENEATNVKGVYTLGLIAYALNLGKSNLSTQVFDLFRSKSLQSSEGNTYWSKTPGMASSSDIELSSYGLLVHLYRNDLLTALSIVNYLISRSNPLGSYSNTHDTVLALQAFSEFGIKTITKSPQVTQPVNENYTVNINATLIDKNNKLVQENKFVANDDNAFVLQSWNLPSCDYKVTICHI